MAVPVEIRLLGGVEAAVDGRPVRLGTPQQRAILAMLALHANQAVSIDRLVEGLWDEEPPPTAAKMIQLYVSQLRKLLPGAIDTRGRGYELRVGPDAVDATRFARLVERLGRGPAENGLAREALAMWRPSPLADIAELPFAGPEIRRLEEARLTALDAAIDADLADGRHRDLLPELEALVAEHPWSERLHEQRMLALYRSGRQGEALAAYQQARQELIEQLGVEPGPALQRLHTAILRQDPGLGEPAAELPAPLDVDSRLVGRDRELSWLRDAWAAAARARGRVIALEGPDGIGKTRLAAALATRAHADGAHVRYLGARATEREALGVVEQARAAGPCLLVLDDADAQTAEVIHAVATLVYSSSCAGLLVLATARATVPAALGADRCRLAPLSPAAIETIATAYGRDPPVERLHQASGGVPAAVHAAAAAWAQAAAAERVAASSGPAARLRREWEALEARVADDVGDLRAARERAGAPRPVSVCPFKGLAPFDAADADFYCGRDDLVADLVAHVVGARLLAVVGASGSGKSSAVRAGLLPALKAGTLPGSERWVQRLLRPGERPRDALAAAGARTGGETRLVVAVDQFEEVFTACRDEAQRAAFLAELVALADDATQRAVVVLAIRADFYARCAAHPRLARLVADNHVLVGPPDRDVLRGAIEIPAERAGLVVEPELVDALLADLDGEPGALPLLSTALLELWRCRDGTRLRLAAYERTGGVRGAVARLAEDAYDTLTDNERELARRIFLRLSGEGVDAPVRRRVPLSELEADGEGASARVLGLLAERRLVAVDEDAAEVAHEALLREWPRLRGWLEEDADGRRIHGHLAGAARDWAGRARDPADLYRGARLASALDWQRAHRAQLNALEREFLDASRARSEDDARRARGANRRLRALLAGACALLALALLAGVVALDQRERASRSAVTANAGLLDARAFDEPRLDSALLLARAANELADTPETRAGLLGALLRSPAAIAVLRGSGGAISAFADSPAGRTLAAGESSGMVTFLDASTRRPVGRRFAAPVEVDAIAFAPDGRTLAIAGAGYIHLLDPATHLLRSTLLGVRESIGALAFSPDSRTLAAGSRDPSGPARLQLYDGNRVRRSVTFAPHAAIVPGLAFTPDGREIVASWLARGGAGFTMLLDATTLDAVRRWRTHAVTQALSPDGRTVATGDANGTIEFLDLRGGARRRIPGPPGAPVSALRFSPDGHDLLSGGDDGTATMHDVASGAARDTWHGHGGPVVGVAFAGDGRTAFTAGDDGLVIAWDVVGTRRLGRPFGLGPGVPDANSAVVSGDGRTLAVTQWGGAVALVDTGSLAIRSGRRAPLAPSVRDAAISADARVLGVSGAPGFAALHDARSGRLIGRVAGSVGRMAAPRVGRHIVVANDSWVVYMSDRATRRPLGDPIRFPQGVGVVAIGPSDRTVAIGLLDGTTQIWSVRDRRRVATVTTRNGAPIPTRGITQAEFSPDGSLLATGDSGGFVRVFSTATWRPVTEPLANQDSWISDAPISADNRLLAAASGDGTVALWDIRSGVRLGVLPGGPGYPAAPAFAPDGKHLFIAYPDGRGYRWDIQLADWRRRACAIAGRALTRKEWDASASGQPRTAGCS